MWGRLNTYPQGQVGNCRPGNRLEDRGDCAGTKTSPIRHLGGLTLVRVEQLTRSATNPSTGLRSSRSAFDQHSVFLVGRRGTVRE